MMMLMIIIIVIIIIVNIQIPNQENNFFLKKKYKKCIHCENINTNQN